MSDDGPPGRPLDVRWIHGSAPGTVGTDPAMQVHAYDEHTYVLRQDKSVHYEAPFLVLLFGEARALLLDTGATGSADAMPLRAEVDRLVEGWLRRNPRDAYELLVMHTHSHGDHVAGDAQMADRPGTTVVGAGREEAWAFLGLVDDRDQVVELDLGGRVLLCMATPGHDAAAVTYYDPRTGWLLTGDTVYPGRLYVEDWAAFARSVDRLADFAGQHPVTYLVGCHVEMSREPGVDYPIGSRYQPDELPLELPPDRLQAIQAAVAAAGGRPGRHVHDDFVLVGEDGA